MLGASREAEVPASNTGTFSWLAPTVRRKSFEHGQGRRDTAPLSSDERPNRVTSHRLSIEGFPISDPPNAINLRGKHLMAWKQGRISENVLKPQTLAKLFFDFPVVKRVG